MLMDGRSQAQGLHERGTDATLLLVFNSHHEPVDFTLPDCSGARAWALQFDTSVEEHPGAAPITVSARAITSADRLPAAVRAADGHHVNDATLRSGVRSHSMPFGAELRDDGTVRLQPLERYGAKRGGAALGRAGLRDLSLERQTIRLAPRSSRMRPAAGSLYRIRPVRWPGSPGSRLALPAPEMFMAPARSSIRASTSGADAGWHGRPWHEAVIYELHVEAACCRGQLMMAMRERLPDLANLGVTAIRAHAVGGLPGTAELGL